VIDFIVLHPGFLFYIFMLFCFVPSRPFWLSILSPRQRVLIHPTIRVRLRLRLIIQTSQLGSYMRKSAWSTGRVNICPPPSPPAILFQVFFHSHFQSGHLGYGCCIGTIGYNFETQTTMTLTQPIGSFHYNQALPCSQSGIVFEIKHSWNFHNYYFSQNYIS